ncbi:MAG: hypothetical protein ACI4EH_04115 [Oliverpabstia sp.]
MKRSTYLLTALLLFLCLMSGCNKDNSVYSGLVVTYGGDPLMFELQTDKGKNYGFVITQDTELLWEDNSAFQNWEITAIDYDDWDVFGCSMRVDVIPGEETESADEYVDECVENWHFAKKITVTKVEDDYFAVDAKPVIYLYPEQEMNVSVTLDYDGTLTCTYPEYHNGWNITACPDGTLTDQKGQSYNYLYWEGLTKMSYDFSEGFCVPGSETAEFLEKALSALGLTRKEANEFIVFWLPLMQENPYNIISFQTDTYTDHARLTITPEPDTVIRVFMAYQPSNEEIAMKPQLLTSTERTGFTAVEWGGTLVTQTSH